MRHKPHSTTPRTAAGFVGWGVLLRKKHSGEQILKKNFSYLGSSVASLSMLF
jgi:hypothetical protein